jgi:serine protease SohB
MVEFLFEYGLFLLKVITFVVAIVVVLVLAMGLSGKNGLQHDLSIDSLNDKYSDMRNMLRQAVLSKHEWKAVAKADKKAEKAKGKSAPEGDNARKRTYVINFDADIRASAADSLREEVSAVLSVARPVDEVVVGLENPGGTVHDHGFAASQLQRIRGKDIPLVVIVDKVAASGGYLMACVANRIIAAPFAIIGSVGVIAQVPNFSRVLEKQGVDFEQVTAGKYKRTVTMFGKNTDEDRAKLKEELEEVHHLFKSMVAHYRPELDIERVATGEHWYGTQAIELGLIDAIGSSDDYLMSAITDSDIYAITFKGKQPLFQRIQQSMMSLGDSVADWVSDRDVRSRFDR